ncbi:MAG: hypothetical protein O7F76_09620 [Planctomycetota bacterium]|nr:hypothetical protein [Planctomycetota bacterium]
MSTRILNLAIVCFLCPPALLAQQPNDAKNIDPADRKWSDARVEFIRDAYGLSQDQARKFSDRLMSLWNDQRQYQFETNVTLRGIRSAMRDVTATNLVAPARRMAFLAKFERQKFEFVYLKAPMSFASVLKGVEADLSPEQVKAGRDKLKKSFKGAAEFSPNTVDWDLRRPVEMPSMALKKKPPIPAFEPMDETDPPPVPPSNKTTQLTQKPKPPTARTITPPVAKPPPKPLGPAPPVEQWAGLVNQTTAKYKFTTVQSTKAQAILTQCRDKASAHEKENEAAYQQAAAIADVDERAAKLRSLNLKLDTLYDQLAKRVESLATLEQKQAVVDTEEAGGA